MINMYSSPAKLASTDEDFHSTNSSESSVFDEQSESDYFDEKSPVRRGSERVRKSRVSDLDYLEVKKPKFSSMVSSSISDATSDEDVAHCLIMMSRDKWWWRRRVESEYKEVEEEEEDSEVDEKVLKNKVKGKYRCETCHKFFKSYQALGGHRANHRKSKQHENSSTRLAGRRVAEERVHECPFCDRVFSSGQALGGHKRTHFINGGANLRNVTTTTTTTSHVEEMSNDDTLDIDLNLPAPEYDRVRVSSGVEFVHSVKC